MGLEDYSQNKHISDENLYSLVKLLFANNINVSSYFIQNKLICDNSKLIEYIYELQAGSYIKVDQQKSHIRREFCRFMAECIRKHSYNPKSVLDCGTGELTTLLRIVDLLPPSIESIFATDISLSRLNAGKKFWSASGKYLPTIFCSNMEKLPLPDKSIDLIITNHSIEPNGKNTISILDELLRVSKKIIAFEPSYKNNSVDGKNRMKKLGYISELEELIPKTKAGVLDCIIEIPRETLLNPLNPTYCYVIRGDEGEKSIPNYTYPGTSEKLDRLGNSLYSSSHDALFPIFNDIPILRKDALVRYVTIE
jgi:hypothetical protein